MKYSLVTLALVAAAQAQSRSDIPECAIPCLDKAIESETSCNIKDYVCVCENFSKVRGIATTCVIEKCGADVAVNKVLPATEALCENPKDESGGSSDKETSSVVSAPAATVTTGTTTVAAETATVDETATAVETTTVAVDTTTVAVDTTTVASVPEVSTTLVVIPPITPNATTGTPSATGGSATPSESVVVDNGAAVLTGLGGIAMVALAALAL